MSQTLINSIKKHGQRFIHYKYNFLPKDNNTYQLLINGNEFYPAMLDSIRNAKSTIYIIQYIFETSLTAAQFIEALTQATKRGVKVYLLIDAFGSNQLDNQDRHRIKLAGIEIQLFNPLQKHHLIKYLYRDHRKLLVIDNSHAYIGGAGICDDYNYPIDHPQSWQDIVVKVTGTLAIDCITLAQKHLKIFDTQEIRSESENQKVATLQLRQSHGRLLISRSWRYNEIQRAIINAISKSNQRIWITTPYFVPTRKLRKKLKTAAHQGCDVRLLLPGKDSDHPWVNQVARQIYSNMLKNGIQIFEFQPKFTHAKAILCDDWVCIGSSNLDRWNQKFNHELNIEIQSPQLASDLARFFESSFIDSIQIDKKRWMQRSQSQKIKEWFWSKVVMWLERFIHNMR